MIEKKDPMGAAIADYWKQQCSNGQNGMTLDTLRVFSPDFDEDEMPLDLLFRSFEEMPDIEQKALNMATGRILDVGAGAGCHSMALQKMGKDVEAIDISPLSVATMKARGIEKVKEQDFFTITEQYDTILMLMNGIGIVGTTGKLPQFFKHIESILTPGGQLILDSSDLCYLYEDEDGIVYLPESDKYYGELTYQMQYKEVKGDSFPWLYIDFATLSEIATMCGFTVELIAEGEHYDYLARITRN